MKNTKNKEIEMKKMMTMFVAVAMAMTVSAASVDWWAELINSDTGVNPEGVKFYVFALGAVEQFVNNSSFVYNPNSSQAMLTTTPAGSPGYSVFTSPFLYLQEEEFFIEPGWTDLKIVWGNPTSLDDDTGSPANQWWAVVIVDDATPNLCGIHIFEVTGLKDTVNVFNAYTDDPNQQFDLGQYTATIIPEPATALLALAGIGLLIAQKRKRA